MVRSSYIMIVFGMGYDVPILGALVTLLKADGLLLFLMMFLCKHMVRSSCIIIVSGMGDDVNIVIWSSGHLVIWSYGPLVNMVI